MADLLTPSEYAEFKAAIKDVTDTFNKFDVRLKISVPILSKFNESKKTNYSVVNHDLKALAIYGTDENGDFVKMLAGSLDLSEGYILINWTDVDEAGLIDPANNVLINAATDTFLLQGLEYTILSAKGVGPVENYYALVKIMFKKKLKK